MPIRTYWSLENNLHNFPVGSRSSKAGAQSWWGCAVLCRWDTSSECRVSSPSQAHTSPIPSISKQMTEVSIPTTGGGILWNQDAQNRRMQSFLSTRNSSSDLDTRHSDKTWERWGKETELNTSREWWEQVSHVNPHSLNLSVILYYYSLTNS